MKYLPSQELFGWLFGSKKKTPPEEKHVNSKAFTSQVTKQQLQQLKISLKSAEESVIKGILEINCNYTPESVKADMTLCKNLQNEYDTAIRGFRKQCLSIPPQQIGESDGPKYNAVMDAIDKYYTDTLESKDFHLDYNKFKFWEVPVKYKALVQTLISETPHRSLSENGFNKDNLGLLIDHVILFHYDNKIFQERWKREGDEFYKQTYELLRKSLPWADWKDSDLSDDENMRDVEDDEGCVSYAFSQNSRFMLEDPFSELIIEGCGLHCLDAVSKMTNRLK